MVRWRHRGYIIYSQIITLHDACLLLEDAALLSHKNRSKQSITSIRQNSNMCSPAPLSILSTPKASNRSKRVLECFSHLVEEANNPHGDSYTNGDNQEQPHYDDKENHSSNPALLTAPRLVDVLSSSRARTMTVMYVQLPDVEMRTSLERRRTHKRSAIVFAG